MASEAASYREDVEQVQRRFSEFRQAHGARSRLPEQLWAAAAKLARLNGIAATARALGVDRPLRTELRNARNFTGNFKLAQPAADVRSLRIVFSSLGRGVQML